MLLDVDGPEIVDHIDGNPLNNCKLNLRVSCPKRNAQNRKKKSGTTSKYFGVTKTSTGWVSYLNKDKKRCFTKTFSDENNAARFRDLFIRKHYPDSHYKMNFDDWNDEIMAKWTQVFSEIMANL